MTTDTTGVATFTDLTLNLSVGPWQLVFLDANEQLVSAFSSAIVLSPGPVESIVAWSVADTTPVSLGGATLLPSVKVIDKVGNGIPGVTVGWQVLDPLSRLPDSTSTHTDANGIANPGRWVTPVVPGLLTFTIQATPLTTPPQKVENAPISLYAIANLP